MNSNECVSEIILYIVLTDPRLSCGAASLLSSLKLCCGDPVKDAVPAALLEAYNSGTLGRGFYF